MSALPSGGWGAVAEPFRLQGVELPGSLPMSHACFNTLVLPLDIGASYEAFRRKLALAISDTEGFGVL